MLWLKSGMVVTHLYIYLTLMWCLLLLCKYKIVYAAICKQPVCRLVFSVESSWQLVEATHWLAAHSMLYLLFWNMPVGTMICFTSNNREWKDAQVWSFFLFGKDAEAHVLLGHHPQLLFLLLFAAFAWKSHRPRVTVFSEKEILLLTGQLKEQPSQNFSKVWLFTLGGNFMSR